MCLRYGETEKQLFLHEAEMANSFRHEYILDFHGVVIASSYSPYVALVSIPAFTLKSNNKEKKLSVHLNEQ